MALSPDEIRARVSADYAARVRPTLRGADELIPVVAPEQACCAAGSSCCGSDAADVDITNIARIYAETDVSQLPATVTDIAFGCGNPTAIATLQPGETVLDLGSGGGIDCFLAAKMVGHQGRVLGVDMTPEMIALARKNAVTVGAENVEFRLGEIENLPVEASSVDVIISNCVVNLSPDKQQVFRDAFRVLRPGGRLQVSDIVWTKPVPADIEGDMDQWSACVGGAIEERAYLDAIAAAGFTDITSVATEYDGARGLASANIVAFKPQRLIVNRES